MDAGKDTEFDIGGNLPSAVPLVQVQNQGRRIGCCEVAHLTITGLQGSLLCTSRAFFSL